MGMETTSAASAPATIATGTGSPVRTRMFAATYDAVPQNAAWPKESSPT